MTVLGGLALLLLLLVIAAIGFRHKVANLFGMPLSDILNFVALLVALFSLYIAMRSYDDATKSGEQQQKVLESSRQALEKVVGTAQKQQNLLEQNLEASRTQLAVVKEQWQTQLELLKRKPKLKVVLDNISLEGLKKAVLMPKEFRQEGTPVMSLTIDNLGNAPVIKPTIIVKTSSKLVLLQKEKFTDPMIVEHPSEQIEFTGARILDIQPHIRSKTPYEYRFRVFVPDEAEAFDLQIRVFGENLDAKDYKVDFEMQK